MSEAATVEKRKSARPRTRLGPYSRVLELGAGSATLDLRSWEGRFLRAFERQLSEHVGGAPSIVERLLISRLARVALRLELFDRKIDGGSLTDHDARVYGALHGQFRLMLRELGMKGTTEAPGEALRRHTAALAEREAAERRRQSADTEKATTP